MAYIFSPKGHERYREVARIAASKTREASREMGIAAGDNCDWHDNGAYDSAMQDAHLAGTKLEEISMRLAQAQIKPYPKTSRGIVEYGTNVILEVDGHRESYAIVGFGDENPDEGRILYTAPIARAAMNRRVGDNFKAQIGPSQRQVKVLEIMVLPEDVLTLTTHAK